MLMLHDICSKYKSDDYSNTTSPARDTGGLPMADPRPELDTNPRKHEPAVMTADTSNRTSLQFQAPPMLCDLLILTFDYLLTSKI